MLVFVGFNFDDQGFAREACATEGIGIGSGNEQQGAKEDSRCER